MGALTNPKFPYRQEYDQSDRGDDCKQRVSRSAASDSLAEFTDLVLDIGESSRTMSTEQLDESVHYGFYNDLAHARIETGVAGQNVVGVVGGVG